MELQDKVLIGIGSNLGNRLNHIQAAIETIAKRPGIELVKCSSIQETEPVDYLAQPKFLNAVIWIKTSLSPEDLLDTCQEIERSHMRTREVRYGPRTLDLDILYYGDKIIYTDRLQVPHPKIMERPFIISAIEEICPDILPAYS